MGKIKNLLTNEQPREKLLRGGARTLSDSELLAIILGTGVRGKTVLEVSRDLIKEYHDIRLLKNAVVKELKTIRGIGEAKAIELIAAIEIGRRVFSSPISSIVINKPLDTYNYLKDKFSHQGQEELLGIFLDAKGKIIGLETIFVGTINKTLIQARDILKWAFRYSAYGIIISHNHPSGDPVPSRDDIKMTTELSEACRTVGITLFDHIIVGHDDYYSFLERGEIKL